MDRNTLGNPYLANAIENLRAGSRELEVANMLAGKTDEEARGLIETLYRQAKRIPAEAPAAIATADELLRQLNARRRIQAESLASRAGGILAAIALVLGLGGAQPAHAGEWFTPYRTQDTVRQAIYTGLLVVDYGQTLDIKNHPELEEKNPLLGPHPTDSEITRHFVVGALLHAGVTWAIPRDWRPYWQYITIGVEAGYVANNFRIGLSLDY